MPVWDIMNEPYKRISDFTIACCFYPSFAGMANVEKLAAFDSSGLLVFIFLAFALFKDSIIPKIKLNDWFSMTKNNLYLKHHALLLLDHLQ